ncbi:unnamed protein product [Discula destructiva]
MADQQTRDSLAVQELTTLLLAKTGLTVKSFGRHWQESIHPVWVEHSFKATFLRSFAAAFKSLHDAGIEVDAVEVNVIAAIRLLMDAGLMKSAKGVLTELCSKEQGVIKTSASRVDTPDTDVVDVPTRDEIENDIRGLESPAIPSEDAQAVDDSEDTKIMKRFSGRLSPLDPVWDGETLIQFPEGLLHFPLALSHNEMSKIGLPRYSVRRKTLTPPLCDYLREAMAHQIRPGYSPEVRAKIEKEIRDINPMRRINLQPFFWVLQRLSKIPLEDRDSTTRPCLTHLEVFLNFVLFETTPTTTRFFTSLGLQEMLDYNERFNIDQNADEGRGTVTVASSGRLLPVSLEDI